MPHAEPSRGGCIVAAFLTALFLRVGAVLLAQAPLDHGIFASVEVAEAPFRAVHCAESVVDGQGGTALALARRFALPFSAPVLVAETLDPGDICAARVAAGRCRSHLSRRWHRRWHQRCRPCCRYRHSKGGIVP